MTFIKLTEQDSPLQLFGRNSVSEAERLDQKGLELNDKLKILDNQIAFLLAVNECPPTGSVKPKLKTRISYESPLYIPYDISNNVIRFKIVY